MQDEPKYQNEAGSTTTPVLPDELPPTLRRLRGDPSQSLHSSTFDPIPYELESPSLPHIPDVVQPSAQMRALRSDQLAIATAIITTSFFVSRLLSLLRLPLFAGTFNGSASDEFSLAFTLPNAVYNIIAGGALSSAFIPVFTDYMVNRHDRKTAWRITSAAFNITGLLLIVVGIVSVIFMPQLARLFAVGIFTDPTKHAEIDPVIQLSRLMMLQPILLGISVISTSVLQARQRFLLPAIGSVLYNVGLIVGIVVTIYDSQTRIFGGHLGILGPTLGVIGGALAMLLIQIPGLISGKMTYSFTFNFLHPGIITMFQLMIPRIINALALYVGAQFVQSALLSTLKQEGSVYGYQQAFQVVLLPIGIFGMSLSQAAFPSLATFVAMKDWDRVRSTVLSAIRIILYLSIPTSMGMIVLAQPITRLLFVHGVFTVSRAPTVYIPLIYFAIGTPALALIEILVRAYYALKDAKTAVIVGIVELFFLVGLSILLIEPLGSGGMALATSIGATGEALALLLILRPRIGGFRIKPLLNFVAGVIAASLVATLAVLLTYTLIEVVARALTPPGQLSFFTTYIFLFIEIAIAGSVGAGAYWLASKFLGIERTLPVEAIMQRVSGRLRRRR